MANKTTSGWSLQRSRRPKGWYFQATYGKGKARVALTLGYLDEGEESLAREHLGTMPTPQDLVITAWDREGAAPPPPSKASMTAAAKRWLLDTSAEDAMADLTYSEASRLEAQGLYGDLTLAEFFNRLWWPTRKAEVAESTVKRETWQWENHLLPALGHVKVKDLDAVRWQRFLASKTTWGGRSKALCQTAYRTCLTYAVEIGAAEKAHAFRKIPGSTKVQNPRHPLLPEEVTALLDATRTAVHRALYATAIGQGLRPSEVTRIHWEDINWQEGEIRIRGTKTDLSDAVVPMTPLTIRELGAYWKAQGKPTTGHTFQRAGKPITEWKRGIRMAGKRAGIPHPVSPYTCRHTFAMLAAMSGVPKAATKAVMRHSARSQMVETAYSNIRQEQVREAIKGFPSLG